MAFVPDVNELDASAQRHRCMCPCRSLDCIKLSQNAEKRATAYRAFGWTRRAKAYIEGRICDGTVKLHNLYVARGHFAAGDIIVRGAGAARLAPIHGVGVASRAYVPGLPGAAGRYTPTAIPTTTPQTADRDVASPVDAALAEIEASTADVSAAHDASIAAAQSIRRELEAKTAELAQLRRALASAQERAAGESAAPAWRRVGVLRKRRESDVTGGDDHSPSRGHWSPCMRWDRVRSAPERELRSLTGFATAAQFEALIRWIDADGLLTDATLISSDRGRAAARSAGVAPAAGERAEAPAYVPVERASRDEGGRPRELSVMDWSLLCMYIVRQNATHAHAAYTFGISDAQVSAYFSTWFCLVDAWLDVQMPMPSADSLAATTPPAWIERLGSQRGVAIIDATPVRTQAPKDGVRNAQLYGQYYGGTAVKVQVVSNPLGATVHITSGVGGSVSDDVLAAFADVATALPPGTSLLADRGYVQLATNHELLARGSCLIRPQFRTAQDASGESVLTSAQVSSTANIANMRSVVERVNGAAKTIFPWLARKHFLQQIDVVVVVVRVLFRFTSFWPVLLDVTQTAETPADEGAAEPRAKRRRRVPSLGPGAGAHRVYEGSTVLNPPRTPISGDDEGGGAGMGADAGARDGGAHGDAGAGDGAGVGARSVTRKLSAARGRSVRDTQ